jgi:hypothetical protein
MSGDKNNWGKFLKINENFINYVEYIIDYRNDQLNYTIKEFKKDNKRIDKLKKIIKDNE